MFFVFLFLKLDQCDHFLFLFFSLFKIHSVTTQAPPSPHTPAVQSLDMFQSSAGKNKLAKHVDDVWDLWHGFKLPQTYSVTHVITPTQVFACSSVRSHALESCWCRSHWELVLLLPDGVCSVCVCVWLLLWCRFFLFFLICAVAYTCGRLALFSSVFFTSAAVGWLHQPQAKDLIYHQLWLLGKKWYQPNRFDFSPSQSAGL